MCQLCRPQSQLKGSEVVPSTVIHAHLLPVCWVPPFSQGSEPHGDPNMGCKRLETPPILRGPVNSTTSCQPRTRLSRSRRQWRQPNSQASPRGFKALIQPGKGVVQWERKSYLFILFPSFWGCHSIVSASQLPKVIRFLLKHIYQPSCPKTHWLPHSTWHVFDDLKIPQRSVFDPGEDPSIFPICTCNFPHCSGDLPRKQANLGNSKQNLSVTSNQTRFGKVSKPSSHPNLCDPGHARPSACSTAPGPSGKTNGTPFESEELAGISGTPGLVELFVWMGFFHQKLRFGSHGCLINDV